MARTVPPFRGETNIVQANGRGGPRARPPGGKTGLFRAVARKKQQIRGAREPRSGDEKEAHEVEEDRGGEAERIDAVEHASVPLDEAAEVLHAAVALDGRHREAAEESEEGDGQRHGRRLPRREGGHPPERGPD